MPYSQRASLYNLKYLYQHKEAFVKQMLKALYETI